MADHRSSASTGEPQPTGGTQPPAGISRRDVLGRYGLGAAGAIGLGAVGLGGLAGCSGGGGGLSFWKPPVGELAFEQTFNKKLIAEFTKANKNTKVDLLIIPWESALPKYTAGYSGSNPPDLAYEVLPWMNKFRGTGALTDLTKLGSVDKYFQNVPADAVAGATGDKGQRYAVPFSAGHFGLTLNEDIWMKAGRPPIPTTYQELIPFAQKLTFDKAGKQLGAAGFDPKNIATFGMCWPGVPSIQTNYVWHYLWAYGADMVSKDKKDIGFGGPEGRAALTHMKALVDSGGATPPNLFSDPEAWADLLFQGRVALQWLPNVNPTQENRYKTKLRALPLPKGPAGTFVVGGVGYYSIASKSDKKKEAFALLEFLFAEAKRKEYIRDIRVYPFGDPPAGYYDGVGDSRVENYLTTVSGQTKNVRITPVLSYDPQDYLLGKFNDYFLGRTSLDAMIKDTSNYVKQQSSKVK